MSSGTRGAKRLSADDWSFRLTSDRNMVRMRACPRGVSTEEVARIVVRLNSADIDYLCEARADGNWIVIFTKISRRANYNHRCDAIERLKRQITAAARPNPLTEPVPQFDVKEYLQRTSSSSKTTVPTAAFA